MPRALPNRHVAGTWRRPVVALAACLFAGPAAATCEQPAGHLVSAQAAVELRAAGESAWRPITPPHALCAGDLVTLRAPGRAAIVLDDGTLVRLDQHTTLHLRSAGRELDADLGLAAGVIHVITRLRKRFGIGTPFVNALVEGTEFTVASGANGARVAVASGVVRARNAFGEVVLLDGEAVEAGPQAAPGAIAVRPLETMHWAIHYPQIVWHDAAALAGLAPTARAAVLEAQQHMAGARYVQALAVLDGETRDGAGTEAEAAERPEAGTDGAAETEPGARTTAGAVAPVQTLRATLLLALGRVDAADAQIARLAAQADAAAAALQAIIHVARNERAAALAALQRAQAGATDDATAATAELALSYVRQAEGEPGEALAAARRASERAPGNPFAWARRAELELALSQVEAGRGSAGQALARAPALPRAHTLLGFAQLLGGATAAARDSFAAAIAADSADPLPRFGNGLAHVRAGEFAAGRREIELAVLLDPADAELRSYLGRLYVEEDRAALGGRELALARRLDPASPTPWHFDAFRRLRDNDPLGALADGNRAIMLNDNRTVLRSPLLLDIDRAARSIGLGPAYAELGFDQSLRAAALAALDDDPAGPAGHRLLAGAYAELPRLEQARLSELLQAQLRQPIGQLPVPPQFLDPGLPIVDGPRALAPEEAAALFERGPGQFAASVLAGSHGTRGASLLGARSSERAQISLGHFDYRRDGLDERRDIALSGTRLGLQLAPTPATMLLADLGSSERRGGEVSPQLLAGAGLLPLRLDHRIARDSARLSLRHAPTLEHELIITAATQRTGERSLDRLAGTAALPFDVTDFDLRTRLHADEVELLYAVRGTRYGLIAGGGHYRERSRSRQDLSLCCLFGPEPLSTPLAPPTRARTTHDTAFAYLDLRPLPWAKLHLGASHAALDARRPVSVSRTSAKLGARIRLAPATTLGLAAFEGVKGPKYRDQTLEPTHFAGFNQLFDDLDGTRWRRRAVGLDHRFAAGGGAGFEWSHRRLAVPGLGCGSADCLADWDERLHRAYLELPLGRRAAVAAAWHFERLALAGNPADSPSLPYRVRTELLPLSLWLRPAARLAAQLEAVRVHQRAAVADGLGGVAARTTRYWLANARLAYLRADRRAALSVAVYNLFDRRAAFQNTDFSGNPRVPLFYPERTVLLQASLRF